VAYWGCMALVGGGSFIAGGKILALLGFTSAGIKAGSWAAMWMAKYGGFVPKNSLFAYLQSLGVKGAQFDINKMFGSVPNFCEKLTSFLP